MLQTRQDGTSLAGLMNGIDQCESFVRDLAAVILPQGRDFESVMDLTNRVYERCCTSRPSMVARGRSYRDNMALSA